ncbi:two-component sensor histidine kinase, partial [Streptomyces sp. MCAF7]
GLVTAAELLPPGEAAGYVRDRVRVLSTLVEDLLEISRLDAGAERADLSPCPLQLLVAEAVARTALDVRLGSGREATGRGTEEGAGDDGPTVWTDPRRMERIVANLVVNAHRHGRAPVEVTVDPDRRTVTV